jgi:hypothetical protein
MTLKDKLQVEIMDLPIMDEVIDDIGTNLEYVADNFAKEVLRTYISNKTLQYKQSQGDYSLDELLLIIKKEKGL